MPRDHLDLVELCLTAQPKHRLFPRLVPGRVTARQLDTADTRALYDRGDPDQIIWSKVDGDRLAGRTAEETRPAAPRIHDHPELRQSTLTKPWVDYHDRLGSGG